MRTKEGVGKVAPKAVRVHLTDDDHADARKAAESIAEYRGYRRRTDDWGRGYFRDPAYPMYVGFLGEFAVRNWAFKALGIRLVVDTGFKPRGDGDIDAVLCGYGLQVKTAVANYTSLLIRTQDVTLPAEEQRQAKWDVCVRVQWMPTDEVPGGLFDDWLHDDRDPYRMRGDAEIRGVVWGLDFERLRRPERGKGEGEWNYVVGAVDFLPIDTVADKCQARMLRSEK